MANSLSRQIRGFIKAAEEQGFRVKDTRKGVFVYPKNSTDAPVLLHLTPSDGRGVKNARARLRSIGVEC
jgi:hypothetical protein